MAITKSKKQDIIKILKEIFVGAKSVVFVKFKGFSVNNTNTMRKDLKVDSIGYKVARKTLIRKALEGQSIKGDQPELSGEVALAYGTDLIAPARKILDFQKKFKEAVMIVGGIFDGRYLNREEMLEIALIPPVKTLQAQFVNLINSPIQRLAVVLDEIAKKKV